MNSSIFTRFLVFMFSIVFSFVHAVPIDYIAQLSKLHERDDQIREQLIKLTQDKDNLTTALLGTGVLTMPSNRARDAQYNQVLIDLNNREIAYRQELQRIDRQIKEIIETIRIELAKSRKSEIGGQ